MEYIYQSRQPEAVKETPVIEQTMNYERSKIKDILQGTVNIGGDVVIESAKITGYAGGVAVRGTAEGLRGMLLGMLRRKLY